MRDFSRTPDAPPMIERHSGGGAVPVGPWLVGASVVLPRNHSLVTPSVVQSYRWFGEAHVRALARLGIQSTALTPADARSHDTGRSPHLRWACFGSLSPWEVVGREQRKLVGLAQVRRTTGVLLVAGTLIQSPDWRAFATALARPASDGEALMNGTTSCEFELGRDVSAMEFAVSLNGELERLVGVAAGL